MLSPAWKQSYAYWHATLVELAKEYLVHIEDANAGTKVFFMFPHLMTKNFPSLRLMQDHYSPL